MISRCQQQKAWWQDEFGREWKAMVAARSLIGNDCPVCAGTVSKKKLAKYERMMREAMAEQERKIAQNFAL